MADHLVNPYYYLINSIIYTPNGVNLFPETMSKNPSPTPKGWSGSHLRGEKWCGERVFLEKDNPVGVFIRNDIIYLDPL